MSILQYEFMLSIQKARFEERLKRKPFLKIIEETKDSPIPLCYDPRTEKEVLDHINIRMRRIINKRYINVDGRNIFIK